MTMIDCRQVAGYWIAITLSLILFNIGIALASFFTTYTREEWKILGVSVLGTSLLLLLLIPFLIRRNVRSRYREAFRSLPGVIFVLFCPTWGGFLRTVLGESKNDRTCFEQNTMFCLCQIFMQEHLLVSFSLGCKCLCHLSKFRDCIGGVLKFMHEGTEECINVEFGRYERVKKKKKKSRPTNPDQMHHTAKINLETHTRA